MRRRPGCQRDLRLPSAGHIRLLRRQLHRPDMHVIPVLRTGLPGNCRREPIALYGDANIFDYANDYAILRINIAAHLIRRRGLVQLKLLELA
eukprot:scaffold27823_cov30-Prasinocladus_malaysianus.AAC.1